MNLRRLGLTLALLFVLIGAAVMINADVAQEFGTGWTAQYYNNTDLSGSPVLSEALASGINFNWGSSNPRPGVVNDDNFSARFSSVQLFNSGTYEFILSSDDGARVFIDGVLVLDRFVGRALTTDRFQYTLTAGTHSLVVEYFEGIDQAAIQFQWFLISGVITPGTGTPIGGGVFVTAGPTPTATRIPPTSPPPIPPGALSGTVIRASVLLVRSGPFLGAPAVDRVLRGQTYQVLGRDENALWYLIQLSNTQGWVWHYYFNINGNGFNAPITNPFVTAGDPASQTGVVGQSEATLRLRAEPNVLSTQIGRIPWGDLLPILERTRDGWYKVIWRGTVGWVASGFVKVIEGDIGAVPMR
ncbi:MAG: SH3 domain-containing protein [Anaerolineae bacterium]|nr:SH3 domain-containing protein [Anaerolineae bacterium]NUQ06666.1 SH3 domain-containing protein [Anaerolineae bacterium]